MDKTAEDKLKDWFEKPVLHLRKSYGGDAGFVPLILSFALAERLLTVLIQKDGKTKKDIPEYLHTKLGVEAALAEIFWTMYRDGMMHCAQPYNGKIQGEVDWGWDISDKHPALPTKIETKEQGKFIAINPWAWFDHVVQAYSKYPEVMQLNDLRKLGAIRSNQESQAIKSQKTEQIPSVKIDMATQNQTGVCYPKN